MGGVMNKRKTRKVRKPRPINLWVGGFSIIKGDPVDAKSFWIGFEPEVFETGEITGIEARRLSEWLLKAAEWIEAGK
jgi:hypothetical protein